jgi:intein-encoded DNA endonuclease-like protein
MKCSKRNKLTRLPVEMRIRIYEKVMEMKNLPLKQIYEKLKSFNLNLDKETIRTWIKEIKNPKRKLNLIKNFDEKLSYLIGAILGDGCFYIPNNLRGRIVFGVKDINIARKVALTLTHVLEREKMYKVRWSQKLKLYIVEGYSKHLVEFLQKPLHQLREILDKYPLEFLKGIYDAEGSKNIKKQQDRIYPRIFLTNSDLDLLLYAQELLKKFGINSRIYKNTEAGKRKIINGKITSTTKNCYNLCIQTLDGVNKFVKLINFTSEEKSKEINRAVELIKKYGNKKALKFLND